MKHIFYIPILLMFALITSCDKISSAEEGGETSGSYIFFEPEVLEGVEVKSDNLVTGDKLPDGKSFGVLGYYCVPNSEDATKTTLVDIFGDPTDANDALIEEVYYVSTESGSSYYKYNDLALWKQNINHDFYGFYPYDIISSVNLNNGDPYIEYTQPTTMEGMIDILTANRTLTQATATNSSVDLTFTHSLWALDIIVINNQTENPYNPGTGILDPNLYIESATLTLANIPSVGKLNLDGSSVVDSRSTQIYTLHSSAFNNITLGKKDSESSSHNFGPLLFFPTDVTISESEEVQYRLDFKFKNPWGISYDFSYPADADSFADFTIEKFVAGKRYQLTIKKNNGDSFTVSAPSEIPWDTHPEINHEFN